MAQAFRRSRRPTRSGSSTPLSIPDKANRILNILLVAMGLMMLRIFQLSVLQHDGQVEAAAKPRQRVVSEESERGTIRDRFNEPLALNKIRYNVAVVYSQIRELPAVVWEKDASGQRIKRFKRREHISDLAQKLSQELGVSAERLEDLIHAKAALYFNRPYVIKENISEQQYYRFRMLEKDLAGLQAQRVAYRCYPKERVGGEIVGYMGAINRDEYESIIAEKKDLEAYLQAVEAGGSPPLLEGMSSTRDVRDRYKELQERAYGINDYVGKAGIEGRYEEDLRGFHGQRTYYADAKGNYLRELPEGHQPMPGQRVLLTISAELQEYAESLLIDSERLRDGRSTKLDRRTGGREVLRQPWIKGGAIVAMDPHNGEVLALASYPRFDPNDFVMTGNGEIDIGKQSRVLRWYETEDHIEQLWNGQRLLEREVFENNEVHPEQVKLDWNEYLARILPEKHAIAIALERFGTIADAVAIQREFGALVQHFDNEPSALTAYDIINAVYRGGKHQSHRLKESPQYEALVQELAGDSDFWQQTKTLDKYFSGLNHNYDKVLFADIAGVAVDANRFSAPLLAAAGRRSLQTYREETVAFLAVQDVAKGMAKELFHDVHFRLWRQENGRAWLKEQRVEERDKGRWARPYIDLLDRKERELFKEFWEEQRWTFLGAFVLGTESTDSPSELEPYLAHYHTWAEELSQGAHCAVPWRTAYTTLQAALRPLEENSAIEYLKTMRAFSELNIELWGRYRHLRRDGTVWRQKHLAAGFYPLYGYSFARSYAYRHNTTQGSVFKVVTAYAALVQQYRKLVDEGRYDAKKLNPLLIVDKVFRSGTGWAVGQWMDGTPIPRLYKGGRLPRSYRSNLGEMDLTKALKLSGNPYFSLLAGDILDDPDDLANAAADFGYGSTTGIDLPGEAAGKIPNDLQYNQTGLYSFAIGQHSLVATPLQTAVMLAALANGGNVLKPKIVRMLAGSEPVRGAQPVLRRKTFSYQEALATVGVNFPLFTAAEDREQMDLVTEFPTERRRDVFLPQDVRHYLMDAMGQSVTHNQEQGGGSLSWVYRSNPKPLRDFLAEKGTLVGKTSTSEAMEHIDLDLEKGTNMYNHIWFGGIAFEKQNPNSNTLVIKDKFGNPELVIVVYLRYGGYGKESAPLAAQIAQKWREIKAQAER